ncbi:bacteriocin-like protein [Chryseobacterium luteum]
MKNLKTLSRKELKNLNGGIQTCDQICMTGYFRCCIPRQAYYCAPIGSRC